MNAEVTFDWADVGDANNAADNSTGYGAVDHNYRISKYEVTIGQYAEFLNAVAATDSYGLYHTNMGTNLNIAGISRSGSSGSYSYSVIGSANRPITYVSWFDAARFVNWVENGQGSGSTETGVYALAGATSGTGFTASGSASHWIPTEDEWYKAAYYDPTIGAGDDGDNYHLYATQSSTVPGNDVGGTANQANYKFYNGSGYEYSVTQSTTYDSNQNYLTDVGSFTGSESYYGTFDQNGNVWEWNDAVIGSSRGLRGGSWRSAEGALRSSFRYNLGPSNGSSLIGFRIAGVASVPEPTSIFLLGIGSLSMLLHRKRG